MTLADDPATFPSLFDPPTDGPAGTVDAALAAPDFAALGVPDPLVRALAREGFTRPFPIQAATIQDGLVGRDILGRGETGSGKTLAFGVPVLARVGSIGPATPRRPRGLILVPTRELASQVQAAMLPLARAIGVACVDAVGGVPYNRQIESLRRGLDVLVATPGRLGDLIRQDACALDEVEVVVLDEADQMADLGFLPAVTALLEQTAPGAQKLLFSATLDGDVDALVKQFLHDPVTHATASPTASVATMDHHLLVVQPSGKVAVVAALAARPERTILFARTKRGVDRLVEKLGAAGVEAGALHGDKTQRVRTRALAEFRTRDAGVLVATDVAARGIHVEGISLVLHVDPPRDAKSYLHRAGRTARAGESGVVVTLALPNQRRSTAALLASAGVAPSEARIPAGDAGLAELVRTGLLLPGR